ncbi:MULTISPECIES: peptidoglycan recognition protein [unclassified Streptomyces]|uniref:peptidoglycan recognition protein family protein n=1 Tax=unclassified Streptomyces TaxID=2593676 RepID=UPI0037F83E96
MRASLASSIAVACAAVLALPVSLAAPATAVVSPAAGRPPGVSALPPAPELPGSTQSLPLAPLGPASRALGGGPDGTAEQGLARRDVRPFSLVGVVWDDPKAVLHGTVQVRTRAAGTGTWSQWQDVETHNEEHGADPDTAEGADRRLKGATAPLWVGDSDGVEIRVRGEEPLPEGLRLELVDPGESPTPDGEAGTADAPDAEAGAETGATAEAGADSGTVTDSGTGPAVTAETETGTGTGPDTGAEAEAETSTDARTGTDARTAADVPTRAATGPLLSPEPLAPPASLGQLGEGIAAEAATSAVNAHLAPYGSAWIPAVSKEAAQVTTPFLPETGAATAEAAEVAGAAGTAGVAAGMAQTAQAPAARPAAAAAQPYIGPRPKIITRKGWGADERLREKGFVYTKTVKAAFVHHSATGNNYTCRQAPSVLRSIYRYHVKSSGWRDFGYNFAVDKCGNVYEGRAGGVAKPVLGAHTLGFNTNSMGIVVLGTFGRTTPPAAAVTAVARLTAWKLGLHGVNPKGTAYLVSGGGNRYKKGTRVRFNTIAGHRDGFATECPGARLYGKLGTARTSSAKYQGRR